MAKDFLAARKDKAQEKALKRQLGAHLAICYPVSQPCAAAVTQCASGIAACPYVVSESRTVVTSKTHSLRISQTRRGSNPSPLEKNSQA